MVTEDTYNIDDVVVMAVATGITDTISNTRIMLITADFLFMISPLFTGKEAGHSALFLKAAFVSLL
jgi:hypothetical protein